MGKSILVVDDNGAMRATLLRFLSRTWPDVKTAATASEALHLAQQNRFDCVLTDVQLAAEADGIELARELRRLRTDMKIILMSADAGALEKARQAGFNDLLPKPISFARLDSCLAS